MRAVFSAPARFVRKHYFPDDWQEYQDQFLALFNRFAYIYKPLSGGSWYSADQKWKLSDTEILKAIACVHPKFFIGCRAGKATRYAVLDIDSKSKYHSKQELGRLLRVLSDAGLSKSSLYRSSYSGGWHLYIFFDQLVGSAELHRQLAKLLLLNDFKIAKGTLEIFPHRTNNHSTGLGLRLPLQPGFAWLDKSDLEVQFERAELSATKALELFLDDLESDSNSYRAFKNLKTYIDKLEARKEKAIQLGRSDSLATNVLPIKRSTDVLKPSEYTDFVRAVFQDLPPGIICDNWYRGRLYHLHGLAGPSQRAEAIICVGHYFFYGDPSRNIPALGYGYEQERQWALSKFISARHNGQSKEINAGRSDAMAQIERAASWTPAHVKSGQKIKYTNERPVSWVRENDNRKKDARSRIQQAHDLLKKQQRAFTTVELQNMSGCSRTTLYKHQDIWRATYTDRKDYSDLASGLFANCTHEYNDVVGADSSKIKPPAATSSEIVPPGLLAARRIAYEISARSHRAIQKSKKEREREDKAFTDKWSSEVAHLIEPLPQSLTVERIKALLVLLAHYLSLAPTKEQEERLVLYISELKRELSARIQDGRLFVPDSG